MPVLNDFIKVKGNFELSTSAVVRSPPTLLLHIRLHSIEFTAHFAMVKDLLSDYYPDSSQFQVVDFPLNVGHNLNLLEAWTEKAAKFAAEMSGFSHVIVFVTTHTDPDTGDLWLGHNAQNNPGATTVANESTALFIILH